MHGSTAITQGRKITTFEGVAQQRPADTHRNRTGLQPFPRSLKIDSARGYAFKIREWAS